jgi:hypothetical protein
MLFWLLGGGRLRAMMAVLALACCIVGTGCGSDASVGVILPPAEERTPTFTPTVAVPTATPVVSAATTGPVVAERGSSLPGVDSVLLTVFA